jgi:hypothetical protein
MGKKLRIEFATFSLRVQDDFTEAQGEIVAAFDAALKEIVCDQAHCRKRRENDFGFSLPSSFLLLSFFFPSSFRLLSVFFPSSFLLLSFPSLFPHSPRQPPPSWPTHRSNVSLNWLANYQTSWQRIMEWSSRCMNKQSK